MPWVLPGFARTRWSCWKQNSMDKAAVRIHQRHTLCLQTVSQRSPLNSVACCRSATSTLLKKTRQHWKLATLRLKVHPHQASQRYVDGRHLWSIWRKLWRTEWVAYPFACQRCIWWWRWRDGVARCEQGFTWRSVSGSVLSNNPARRTLDRTSFFERGHDRLRGICRPIVDFASCVTLIDSFVKNWIASF